MNPLVRVIKDSSDPGGTVENAGVSPSRASAANIVELDRELTKILWPAKKGRPVDARRKRASRQQRASV